MTKEDMTEDQAQQRDTIGGAFPLLEAAWQL
jgi:hypothetical protein